MAMRDGQVAERNLMFVGMGLSQDVLSRDRLIRAFDEWLQHRDRSLGEILVEQNAITPDQRASIEAAVEAHIAVDAEEDSPDWHQTNERRLDLIDRKHSVGLTPAEEAELAQLESRIDDHLQATYPRPVEDLDAIDARFQAIKDRIKAKRGNGA